MKSITTKVVGLFLSFVHGIIFYRKDEDWGHGIVEEYFPDMLKPWVWKGKQYKVSNYILLVAASGFKTGKINWINLISSAILYNSLYTTTSTMGSLSTETNIWSISSCALDPLMAACKEHLTCPVNSAKSFKSHLQSHPFLWSLMFLECTDFFLGIMPQVPQNFIF